MTTGFQQQQPLVNFSFPKTATTQHQVGKKLAPKPNPRPAEPRTFK
jgi:hypothetical protein